MKATKKNSECYCFFFVIIFSFVCYLNLVFSYNVNYTCITDFSGTNLKVINKLNNHILLLFKVFKRAFNTLIEITGSNFRSLSNFLNCDLKKFSYCFRTNRASVSCKIASDLRLIKFKLYHLS